MESLLQWSKSNHVEVNLEVPSGEQGDVRSSNPQSDTGRRDFLAKVTAVENIFLHEETNTLAALELQLKHQQEAEEGQIKGVYDQSVKQFITPEFYRHLINDDSGKSLSSAFFNSDFDDPGDNALLDIAVSTGNERLITLILSKKKNCVKRRNSEGDLAFHVAARAGQLRSLICLACWTLNKSAATDKTRSPLYGGAVGGGEEEDEVERVKSIGVEIIGETNRDGNTALHIALENHQEMMAWYLVYRYPQASFVLNAQGVSPFYRAMKARYSDVLKYMFLKQELFADCVPDRLRQGKSVVHAAILTRNIEILAVILGIDPVLIDSFDQGGSTPLSCAAYVGYLEGVQYILESLPMCAFRRDKDGSFPIHRACSGGHIMIVKQFLTKFPNTMDLLNKHGQNVLHVAAKHGKASVVTYLLSLPELERLINLKDADGNSPLHLATLGKHPKVVYILTCDRRVKLSIANNHWLTALDIAFNYDGPLPTFEERLTRLTLSFANAPRAPHPYKVRKSKPPNIDSYKERVSTLLLVATLVATVTFAAGVAAPGGYNNSDPNLGMATLAKRSAFQAFMISNTIAMYSSILAAVTLIWAQLGDLKLIIFGLKFGLPVLGVSLTATSIAFMVGVHLVVSNLPWLATLILAMGCAFLAVILVFFVPLYSPSSLRSRFMCCIFYIPLRLMLFINEKITDETYE